MCNNNNKKNNKKKHAYNCTKFSKVNCFKILQSFEFCQATIVLEYKQSGPVLQKMP
jgi:hypothetical protein